MMLAPQAQTSSPQNYNFQQVKKAWSVIVRKLCPVSIPNDIEYFLDMLMKWLAGVAVSWFLMASRKVNCHIQISFHGALHQWSMQISGTGQPWNCPFVSDIWHFNRRCGFISIPSWMSYGLRWRDGSQAWKIMEMFPGGDHPRGMWNHGGASLNMGPSSPTHRMFKIKLLPPFICGSETSQSYFSLQTS